MYSLAQAYLGLGSNLGDRMKFLQFAIDCLALESGQKVCRFSPVYETTPWGATDQPLYLNAAIEIETESSPSELLKIVKRIENAAGRSERAVKWVERELDIDILIFDRIVMHSGNLVLPHPRLAYRRFVLQPLSDIASDLPLAGTDFTVGTALANCRDNGVVTLYHKALHL